MGVNRLATKGKEILLTTDETRQKIPTSDKKITEIYRQSSKVEILTDNRQSDEILTDLRHKENPLPLPPHPKKKNSDNVLGSYFLQPIRIE